MLTQLANLNRGIDYAIQTVREVVPQATEAAIRRELETTGSLSQTIANLVELSD